MANCIVGVFAKDSQGNATRLWVDRNGEYTSDDVKLAEEFTYTRATGWAETINTRDGHDTEVYRTLAALKGKDVGLKAWDSENGDLYYLAYSPIAATTKFFTVQNAWEDQLSEDVDVRALENWLVLVRSIKKGTASSYVYGNAEFKDLEIVPAGGGAPEWSGSMDTEFAVGPNSKPYFWVISEDRKFVVTGEAGETSGYPNVNFQEFSGKLDAMIAGQEAANRHGMIFIIQNSEGSRISSILPERSYITGTGLPRQQPLGMPAALPGEDDDPAKKEFSLVKIYSMFVQLLAIRTLDLRNIYEQVPHTPQTLWTFIWTKLIKDKAVDWDRTMCYGDDAEVMYKLWNSKIKDVVRLLRLPEFRTTFHGWTKAKNLSDNAREVIMLFLYEFTSVVIVLLATVDQILDEQTTPTDLIKKLNVAFDNYEKSLKTWSRLLRGKTQDEAFKALDTLYGTPTMKRVLGLSTQSKRVLTQVIRAILERISTGIFMEAALTPDQLEIKRKIDADEAAKKAAAAAKDLQAQQASATKVAAKATASAPTPPNRPSTQAPDPAYLRDRGGPKTSPKTSQNPLISEELLEFEVGGKVYIMGIPSGTSQLNDKYGVARFFGASLHKAGIQNATFWDGRQSKFTIITDREVKFRWASGSFAGLSSQFTGFGFKSDTVGVFHQN